MGVFNGEKIYGEIVNKKLVLWISNDLYLRIYRHVMSFLPKSVRNIPAPNYRRTIAMKKFIKKWLISISKRDCEWILKSKVPDQYVKLADHPDLSLSNFALIGNPEETLSTGVVTSNSALMDFSFSIDFGADLITAADFMF